MPFSPDERAALLVLKGVGPVVIERLEQIGISSFDELKEYSAHEIADSVASMLGSTCWKNSPQAKAALTAAIELAGKQS